MKVAVSEALMPAVFLDWQCEARRDLFEALTRGEQPRFLSAHLPVVSTLNEPAAAFPIHSTTKGAGLLPKPEYLAQHVAEITDCLARCRNRPTAETLAERVETALALYDQQERIDPMVCGGIEIFGGRTYSNVLRDPRVSLLFTGLAPRYPSYQFNCLAEIVEPGDPRFEFLRGMRLLFEFESFHIQQPAYPLGYLFHIREVFDKTPRRLPCPRAGGHHTSAADRNEDDRTPAVGVAPCRESLQHTRERSSRGQRARVEPVACREARRKQGARA